MSTGVKINELPSGNFNAKVFDYTDASGKRHYKSITAPTKREVKKLIADFLSARDEKKSSVPDMTVGEAIDKYIEIKSNILSPATVREYERSRKTDLHSLMNIKLSKLTPEMVQIAVNEEAENHSAKSVRNMHGLLSAALKIYAPSIRLTTQLPQKVKPDIEIPTVEEVTALLTAAKGKEIEVPIYLATFCGMRRSEIAALEWKDVNLNKGLMTIRQAEVRGKNYKLVTKNTKSTAGKRIIRIFAPVLEVLKNVSQDDAKRVTNLNPDQIYKRYALLIKNNKLKHYRFHDLRHYAVSVMLALNIPKNYIADYVGHDSEQMIDDVYGHIMKEAKVSFEDKVDEFYAKIFVNAP